VSAATTASAARRKTRWVMGTLQGCGAGLPAAAWAALFVSGVLTELVATTPSRVNVCMAHKAVQLPVHTGHCALGIAQTRARWG